MNIKFGLLKTNGVKFKLLIENISFEFYLFRNSSDLKKIKYNTSITSKFEMTTDYIFLFGNMNNQISEMKLDDHIFIRKNK